VKVIAVPGNYFESDKSRICDVIQKSESSRTVLRSFTEISESVSSPVGFMFVLSQVKRLRNTDFLIIHWLQAKDQVTLHQSEDSLSSVSLVLPHN
jgi:hypothetical protein